MFIQPGGEDKAAINARDYIGTSDTDKLFVSGVSTVVIETIGETLLIDNNMPRPAYGDKDAEKEWEGYISRRAKQGWRWFVTYGYGVFTRAQSSKEGKLP